MLYLSAFVTLALTRGSAPTGAQVLQRCQKAYDSVRSFEEDVRAVITGSKEATAHISFVRPGKLRVSGSSMFGSKYDFIANGTTAWVYNGGSWDKVENPEMGVATITGISANAGTHVPAALLHLSWGSLKTLQGQRLAVGMDRIGGRDTYRVRADAPFSMTLWIDAKTYFLVKTASVVANHTITVNFATPKVNQPIPAKRFAK